MLTAGVGLSAACYLVAGAAELLGTPARTGTLRDLGAVVAGLAPPDPWAWATLGTLVVIATPALGLLTTAIEYLRVSDRGTARMAVAVLLVLLVSAALAFLR
jgi:uncharacterized membrane protein